MTAPRRGAHRSQQSPSGGLFFATDDVGAAYEELEDRGVEFQQEPTEQPYGIDAGFRDPSGNQMRGAAEPPPHRRLTDQGRVGTARGGPTPA